MELNRRVMLKSAISVAAMGNAGAHRAKGSTNQKTGEYMVNFPVAPQRTALIDVDMQNAFVEGYPLSAPDGLNVLARINRRLRPAGGQVYWSYIPAVSFDPMGQSWE